jgi:serine/threonine protein kinase
MSIEPRLAGVITGERWREVSEIVDAALDLAPGRRASFINQRCAGDVLLKAQAERFLAVCDAVAQSPTFMRERPHQYAGDLESEVEEHATDAHSRLRDRVSEAIGHRYDIQEVLGRGGAATVFRAADRVSQESVALKVLHPELSHSIGAERFIREVRVLSSLRHPNIIPLLESGMAGDLPYYVMPLIQGQTLRARLQREPQLPVDVALSIARDVAAALDAAHAQDVLHRDIKPLNILLDGDRALVADFGISRAIESAGGDTLTESGTMLGTPGYMSPEQVSGDAPIDRRSDVYSLACVVFEMLAGEPPYTGSQPRSILAKQLWAPVPDVRVIRGSLSVATSAVLLRALAKDAADRFESASGFLAELSASLKETAPRQNRRLKRISSRAAWALGGLLIVTAGAGSALVIRRASDSDLLSQADYSRLVVFPVEVVGRVSEALEHADPQAAAARWTDLTLVGFQTIRDEVGGRHSLSARHAQEVALSLGARRYIRAVVEPSSAGSHVRTELYDARDHRTPIFSSSRELTPATGLGEAIRMTVDGVLLRTRDSAAIFEGTRDTKSLAARHAFLRAASALRDWQLVVAETALTQALRADAQYARAALWLALVRSWGNKDSAAWVSQAEFAASHREKLDDVERPYGDAMVSLARGDRVGGCAQWRALATARPYDFNAWFGTAHCLELDATVIRAPHSPTGWVFRSSAYAALHHYRRAFALRPAVLASLRDDQFRRLRRILFTSARDARLGRLANARAPGWVAYPVLHADTLAFYPVPLSEFARGNPSGVVRSEGDAVARQRQLLVDIASSWVHESPENPIAHELVAIALVLSGDPSAMDTLAAAYRMAGEPRARDRIALTRTWLGVQLAVPDDVGGARRARLLADSIFALPRIAVDDPRALAGIAVLTGRFGLADSLERGSHAPRTKLDGLLLEQLERRLSIAAAADAPASFTSALMLQAATLASQQPTAFGRDSLLNLLYRRAVPLMFASGRDISTFINHLDTAYYLVRAVRHASHGHRDRVDASLRQMSRTREASSVRTTSFDVAVVEASLLERIGDVDRAVRRIDAEAMAQRTEMPSPDAVIGAALLRAMIRRADMAYRMGDRAMASIVGALVGELLTNADGFLQPTAARMRSYSLARGTR